MKKVMNLKKVMMLAFAAFTALALFSCTMNAESNDGSKAADRLEQGYKPGTVQGGGNSGGGDGEYAFFTGCFIWSEWGSEVINLTFDDTGISAYAPNGCGGWGGFGLGQINESGTAFNASSDLSTLKTVEFDVIAGIETTCKIQVGDDAEQDLSVTTTQEHKVINFNKPGLSNYILIFNGMNVFDSESKKIEITNIVFKDADGNPITRFGTGDVIPEKK